METVKQVQGDNLAVQGDVFQGDVFQRREMLKRIQHDVGKDDSYGT